MYENRIIIFTKYLLNVMFYTGILVVRTLYFYAYYFPDIRSVRTDHSVSAQKDDGDSYR